MSKNTFNINKREQSLIFDDELIYSQFKPQKIVK